MIDPTTPQGRRALRRLTKEPIAWLTTVSPKGTPHTSPVWFLWGDEEALVYSKDDTARTRNLAGNSRVGLHLDGDGLGGDIVAIEGYAAVDDDAPPAHANQEYLDKYAFHIAANGWTPEWFAEHYPVAIRIRPSRARVW